MRINEENEDLYIAFYYFFQYYEVNYNSNYSGVININSIGVMALTNGPFQYITIHEAMNLLGVSRATIDRWRKEKSLPYIKIGKEILFDPEQIQDWIVSHHSQQPHTHTSNDLSVPTIITIGYQTGSAQLWSPLVMKQLAFFEQELEITFPKRHFELRWVNAPNGMELVEELIAGRVHIASVGDYPISASWGLSQVLPRFKPIFLAFDGKSTSNNGISLVVPTGSKMNYIDQLKDEIFSAVSGSSSAYRLDLWKNQHSIQSETIVHRNMGDCLNDIVGRHIGASMLWEPYLSWSQHIGAGQRINGEGINSDYLTGLIADQQWVSQNEDIVICYLKAHLRAHQYIRQQSDQAAALIKNASGFPVEVVYQALTHIHWDASIYQKDVQTLLGMKQSLAPLSLTPYQGEQQRINFRSQYLQQAVESLKLPRLPDFPLLGDWSKDLMY